MQKCEGGERWKMKWKTAECGLVRQELRIAVDNNRSARGALRRLRARVTEALLGVGFKFDPTDQAYRRTQNAVGEGDRAG